MNCSLCEKQADTCSKYLILIFITLYLIYSKVLVYLKHLQVLLFDLIT